MADSIDRGLPLLTPAFARKKTKTVRFNATCIATYKGALEVPEDLSQEEVLDYILNHLGEVPAYGLEYIGDTEEPVTIEDIQNIDDFDE